MNRRRLQAYKKNNKMPPRRNFFKILLVLLLSTICFLGEVHSVSSHPAPKKIQAVATEDISQNLRGAPLLAANVGETPTSIYLPFIIQDIVDNPYQVFLPLVLQSPILAPETVFGVEMAKINAQQGIDQMRAVNSTWIRRNGIFWSDVEPNEGDRNWSVLAGLDQELITASSYGFRVILVVRKTPTWAQKVPGSFCGPISQDKLTAFGNFMYDLVSRYSVPPYNVKYWELWNEPDVDPALAAYIGGKDIPFGCWGDTTQTYYGGEYYAEMLKTVYPRIKDADAQAQVMIGGLLLDCDPRGSPSACAFYGHSEAPPKFLEGILRNGGGDYFDGVGFHVYDPYWGALGQYGLVSWNSVWNSTGPSIIAKTRFIQEVLGTYNVAGKFIMDTEVGLVCGGFNDPPGQAPCESDPSSAFEQTKAYYATELYAASIAEGLRAFVWYSTLGWRNTGLLNSDLSPRPVYTALQVAQGNLSAANWVRDVTEYEGVKGYEFEYGGWRIWVVWSLDGNPHTIDLPEAPLAAWDAFGNMKTSSASMDVDLKPLYLEWNP